MQDNVIDRELVHFDNLIIYTLNINAYWLSDIFNLPASLCRLLQMLFYKRKSLLILKKKKKKKKKDTFPHQTVLGKEICSNQHP